MLGRLAYRDDTGGPRSSGPRSAQWLADNLVGEFAALKGLGGPGREHEAFEERRAWNQHLAAAGLTCLGWPEEHGGRGLTVAHRVAFYEEYARADAPDKVNHFGEELLGPDADRVRHTRAAEALPAQDPRRHRAVVPGLLRAGRRQRPRQRLDHRASSTATSG